MSSSNMHFLRLVKSNEGIENRPPADEAYEEYWQPKLFPETENIVLEIDLDSMECSSFVSLLQAVRPKYVMDLRIVPRFDYAGFSRRSAFELFHRSGSEYLDIVGNLGVTKISDARMNPALVGSHLRSIMPNINVIGPLTFLTDHSLFTDDYIYNLLSHIASDRPWHIQKSAS